MTNLPVRAGILQRACRGKALWNQPAGSGLVEIRRSIRSSYHAFPTVDERTPIRDLGLSLESSRFAPLIKKVSRELKAAGIRLEPRFYLSTEYGCLPRSATIGLLWTDGFDDWRRLAKKRGLRTRDDDAILRTLRHEA